MVAVEPANVAQPVLKGSSSKRGRRGFRLTETSRSYKVGVSLLKFPGAYLGWKTSKVFSCNYSPFGSFIAAPLFLISLHGKAAMGLF